MERSNEPRTPRSVRCLAGRLASYALAVTLLGMVGGCATYDYDSSRFAGPRMAARNSGATAVTVRPGDTLNGIARAHGVPGEILARVNSIDDPDQLRVGQRLILPRPGQAMAARVPRERPRSVMPATPVRVARMQPVPDDPVAVQPDPGLDPRLEGARFYALGTPRPKPGDEVNAGPDAPYDGGGAVAGDSYADAGDAAGNSPATFIWPVRGPVIVPFGGHDGGMRNDGINIAAEAGAPVKAADDGTVIYEGNELSSYGNLLLVRHAQGYVTAYAHNRKVLVKRGMRVKRGQLIALVGDTGNVEGPQLHFEVRRGNKPVDPRRYLVTATASR